MRPELVAIADEVTAADIRLRRLLDATPRPRWTARPAAGRWSVLECVDHLNRTTDAYREKMPAALDEARSLPAHDARRPYRLDPVGWMLWKYIGPPVRRLGRTRTGAAFVPAELPPVEVVVRGFRERNDLVRSWVVEADGLAIDRVKVVSPFADRVRYNAFAGLAVLARHQHRHLWQAEQAAAALDEALPPLEVAP